MIAQVPRPVGESGNRNQTGVDALIGSRSLVIAEVKQLVLDYRSAESPAKLVLPEKAPLR